MQHSKIEWTDHTVNLWHGCTKVHAGCDHCYAEKQNHRWGKSNWGNDAPRSLIKSWKALLDFIEKQGQREGRMQKVFVGSMMDIFEKSMPLNNFGQLTTEHIRCNFFMMVHGNTWPHIVFQFLTKRPSNILKFLPAKTDGDIGDYHRHWFGTSVSDQATANTLIPQLCATGLPNLFVSAEPQIGPIDLFVVRGACKGIGWLIQGGESGPGKRRFDLEWAARMELDCYNLEIPFFFKQIDKVQPVPARLVEARAFPLGM